jgi:hypothetical protein
MFDYPNIKPSTQTKPPHVLEHIRGVTHNIPVSDSIMQNNEPDVKPVDATGNVPLLAESIGYVAGGLVTIIAVCLTLNIFYNTEALVYFFQCALVFCSATAMAVLVWHFRRHFKHAAAALFWLTISCVLYAVLNQWMGV